MTPAEHYKDPSSPAAAPSTHFPYGMEAMV